MTNAHVLVVEDDAALREALCDTLSLAGLQVSEAGEGNEALGLLERAAVDLVVSDVQMAPMNGIDLMRQLRQRRPELPVVLMTAYGSIPSAVEAMRGGAVDYLVKPFDAEDLLDRVQGLLPREGAVAPDEVVAEDPKSRELLALAHRVAGSEATVLLCGESGTGKEVIARYLHASSARAAGPFVAINCAAIPENMLEAVLFGYEKGAFTGAYKSTPGKFEQAQGGTLLLDEISEMDLGLQAKLLRVLQEREVERLGGQRSIPLDLRLLATTNRDLRAEVASGRFREDLYYRLNVFPLQLPPLRERPLDIEPLARRLLARHCDRAGPPPRLTAAALERLRSYHWPGNVRELENTLHRALILAEQGSIDCSALSFELPRGEAQDTSSEDDEEQGGPLQSDLRQREHQVIVEALETAGGSRKLAAERLGISPRTLRYKLARMREQGLNVPG